MRASIIPLYRLRPVLVAARRALIVRPNRLPAARRRLPASIALALFASLALIAGPSAISHGERAIWSGTALVPGPMAGHAAREAGAADSPSSMPAADPAPIGLTLLGHMVEWRTTPHTTVRGRVLLMGEEAAIGYATADGDGFVRLAFHGTIGGVLIPPGARIELLPTGADAPYTFDVPTLAADIDAIDDRVIGRAPSGAALRLIIRDEIGEPVVDRMIRAAADGTVDESLAGEVDILPGQVGVLEMLDADGNRFDTRFAALRLDVRLDDRSIVARSTLGTTITATIRRADGSHKGTLSGRVAPWYAPVIPDDVTLTGAMTTPIEAGDIISIARSGGLIEPHVPDRKVPDLSVRIDSPGRRFVGVGPPSTTLGLIAMGPLDEIFRMEVETNIGGGFESATSEEVGAGWRVELLHDDRMGLRTSALGLQPQVVASVHGSVVSGVNTPGRPIRVALRGPTGALSDTWSVTTPADGGFRVVLAKHGAAGTPRGYWRIRPGDIVEVELDEGDPIVLTVPMLGARTDADAEMVTGRTIPGARLQVVVESDVEAAADGAGGSARSPGGSVIARTSVHADADGTFAVDISGLSGPDGAPLDIEFPMRGRVRSNRPDGHAFEVGWAPIVIRLTMGERSFIQGTGAPGRDVAITLESSDGRLIAATGEREESAVFNGEPYWFAELRDEVGQPVPILGGDQLTVRVGDDVALLRVPSIEGVVHVSDDLVSGRAEPGMLLEARIFGLDGSSADVTADTFDDGSFLIDFGAAGFDVRFNSSVTLSTTVGRHALTRPIDGPGLSIDLVDGTVDGSAQPGLNVELELVRDGGPIARHEFIAPRGGAFKLAFERLDGERLVPREGDTLVMRMDEGPAPDRAIRLTVPALTIDHDLDADLVWGRAAPDGRLELWAEHAVPREDERSWAGEARVALAEDGRYTIAFENEAYDVRPGDAFFAWLQLPSGHFVTTRRIVPIVNAQLNASTACGWADAPGAPVTVAIEGGAATARSALDSSFTATIHSTDGRPEVIRSGDRLSADLAGVLVDVTLPALEIEIDREADSLRVTTAPGAKVMVSWPFGACSGRYVEQAWDGGAFEADAAGHLDLPLSNVLAQAAGAGDRNGAVIEVAVFEPGGHRVFIPIRPLMLDVHIGTARVTGSADPGSPIALQLIARDGAERANTSALAGDDGRFDALLVDTDGGLVAGRPGDTLTFGDDPSKPLSHIVLEPLDFDFDTETGLIGRTTPWRQVMATMRLSRSGGTPETRVDFMLEADADGRFSLSRPPARSEWTFEDVLELRLAISAGDGHRIVSTFTRRPDFGPDGPVFLPSVRAGR